METKIKENPFNQQIKLPSFDLPDAMPHFIDSWEKEQNPLGDALEVILRLPRR